MEIEVEVEGDAYLCVVRTKPRRGAATAAGESVGMKYSPIAEQSVQGRGEEDGRGKDERR